MIPLKDLNPRISFPIITIGIILLNILSFIYMYFLSDIPANLIKQYALFPKDFLLFTHELLDRETIKNIDYKFIPDIFTSMFMHGSWMHLIGNMWFLWIFGDNVEGVMGKIQFLLFYLICGISAAAVHSFISVDPNMPIIGASGAIAGIMGAYLVLFPKAKILTFVPLFLIWLIPIPAFIFLIIWFAGQLLNGIYNLNQIKGISNIAFWAHIGGFIIGLFIGLLYKNKKNRIITKQYNTQING